MTGLIIIERCDCEEDNETCLRLKLKHVLN